MTRVEDSAHTSRRPTVFLHVGAPKTGTTFLQAVLWSNREVLAGNGVLYPGDRPSHHFHAAQDLRGIRFHGHEDPAVPGAWEQLTTRARRWHGASAVLSHEILAWATEDDARRAVESLWPAEVHVVFTARDLVRQIPAVWQESVKNRRLVAFPRYLQSLKEPEKPGHWGRGFWGAQDAVDVLSRWGASVPAERVHVVTVPPPGAPQGLLWDRFAGLVGIEPESCETAVKGTNVSLGTTEVELLRRINRKLGDDVDWPTYERLFKRGLAETVLASRSGSEKLTLPPQWYPWAREQSERLAKGLGEAGYDVVGDLDDLLPTPATELETAPRPGPDAVLDAAAETIATLVRRQSAKPRGVPLSWRRRARNLARRRLRGWRHRR